MRKYSSTLLFSLLLALILAGGLIRPALASPPNLVCNGELNTDFPTCPDSSKVWHADGWHYDDYDQSAYSNGEKADNTLSQCMKVTTPGGFTSYSLDLDASDDHPGEANFKVVVEYFNSSDDCGGSPDHTETRALINGENSFSDLEGTGSEQSIRLTVHCGEGSACFTDDLSLSGENPDAVTLTSFNGRTAPASFSGVLMGALAALLSGAASIFEWLRRIA